MSGRGERNLTTFGTREFPDVDNWRTPTRPESYFQEKTGFFIEYEKEAHPQTHTSTSTMINAWGLGLDDKPLVEKTRTIPLHVLEEGRPFYQGTMSKSETEHRLRNPQLSTGAFLIWKEFGEPGPCFLSMLAPNERIDHMELNVKVQNHKNKICVYNVGRYDTKFLSVNELVNFYSLNERDLPCMLTEVAKKSNLI